MYPLSFDPIAQADYTLKRAPRVVAGMPPMRPRGLGRVQLGVRRAFIAQPGATLHTIALASWCYPRAGTVTPWMRKAIVRAARRVAVRLGRDRQGVIWGEIRRPVATMLPKPPKS